MSGLNFCAECGDRLNEAYSDPRNPPLDLGECLCDGCFFDASVEAVNDLMDQVDVINHNLEEAGLSPVTPTKKREEV